MHLVCQLLAQYYPSYEDELNAKYKRSMKYGMITLLVNPYHNLLKYTLDNTMGQRVQTLFYDWLWNIDCMHNHIMEF